MSKQKNIPLSLNEFLKNANPGEVYQFTDNDWFVFVTVSDPVDKNNIGFIMTDLKGRWFVHKGSYVSTAYASRVYEERRTLEPVQNNPLKDQANIHILSTMTRNQKDCIGKYDKANNSLKIVRESDHEALEED